MNLTLKQEKFAVKYVECGNASEAYRFAYNCENMKPESVNREAKAVSDNLKVATRVIDLQCATADKLLVSEDSVLREFARIGFSDIRKLFTPDGRLKQIHELDNNIAAAVSSIKVVVKPIGDGFVEHVHEIKLWPKVSALDALAKRLGLFEHGEDGATLAEELRALADRLPD